MSDISINSMKPNISDQDMLCDQWEDVFDRYAPFYDSYVKFYSQALINGWPDVLDVHREAIYYITSNKSLAKIIARLIQIATFYPESSFIESLSFFLSNEENSQRIKEITIFLNSSEI